jgi:hypothetical protein
MCAELHFNICKKIWTALDKKHWYIHVPKSVQTCHEDKVILLRNQKVLTTKTIPKKKPDIINSHNEKGKCVLIDAAI